MSTGIPDGGRSQACCEVGPAVVTADEILVVRQGSGANCSSIGSLLDIVLLSAVAGGVVLVAAAAALGGAPASRVPEGDRRSGEADGDDDTPASDAG